MLRLKQLPTFDTVAAGKKAVVKLPVDKGLRIHVIWLRLGNAFAQSNALADVADDIVVKINDKPQRTHTADQLNDLNGLNGAAYVEKITGINSQANCVHYLPIFFAQPWRKKQAEVPALALRATGIDSLKIEVNLRATNGAAAANNNLFLDGWYEFDYDARPIGALQKFIRQDYSVVGTSLDLSTIDKRDFIESIHLYPVGAQYVTEVKFTANGEEIRDRITYLQSRQTLSGRGLVPDTNAISPRFDLVFDYDDPINGQLSTAPLREMNLKLVYSAAAAGTQTAIIQRTGPIE